MVGPSMQVFLAGLKMREICGTHGEKMAGIRLLPFYLSFGERSAISRRERKRGVKLLSWGKTAEIGASEGFRTPNPWSHSPVLCP